MLAELETLNPEDLTLTNQECGRAGVCSGCLGLEFQGLLASRA